MTDIEGKLRRLVEHPSTPEPERQAARRMLERLTDPGLVERSFATIEFRRSDRIPFGDHEAPQDEVYVDLFETRTEFLDRLERWQR